VGLRDEAWRRDPAAYPFSTLLQTRYGDMDANAHLNNVAIARLFEEARLRFHMEVREVTARVEPGAVMIAHVAIDYLAEGAYPADVRACVGVPGVGTRSYRLAIGLFQDGAPFALAECVMVHRGEAVAPALRSALEARMVRR
jgi:acyl-CoA thioester hydrolase